MYPDLHHRQLEDAEVVRGELLVARRHAARLLEPANAALDHAAPAVRGAVERRLAAGRRARRAIWSRRSGMTARTRCRRSQARIAGSL